MAAPPPSAVKLFQTAAGPERHRRRRRQHDTRPVQQQRAEEPLQGARRGSSGGSSGGGDSTQDHLPDNPTRAEKIEYVIYVAQQQLGKPYVYGASGTSKYDCSGLTLYCYKQVGVSLPHFGADAGLQFPARRSRALPTCSAATSSA